MEGWAWASMGSSDPSKFEPARELLVNAVQWLARLANSYVAPAHEHRHLMLEWHPERLALVTQPFADGLSLELRLPDLHMQFAGNGKLQPHVFDFEDHTPAEVEAWILVELLHRDVDCSRFSKSLPYAVTGLLTGDSTDYSPAACMPALVALTKWLRLGTALLSELPPAQTTLHCWPETLQTGRLLPLDAATGDHPPMLRAGISLGDALCPEPFFFVLPDESGARGQPHPGTVLPASRILAEAITPDGVLAFLDAARAANGNRVRL